MLRRFRRKNATDASQELTLSNLPAGGFVDHDLETFEVTARNRYRFEGDEEVVELELRSATRTLYLERYEDDEVAWSVSRKVPQSSVRVGERAAGTVIVETDEAPEAVVYEGDTYYLEEDAAAHFFRNGAGPAVPMVAYEYLHADGERFVTLERWGEDEFEAAAGRGAREYEFTNLLPPPRGP